MPPCEALVAQGTRVWLFTGVDSRMAGETTGASEGFGADRTGIRSFVGMHNHMPNHGSSLSKFFVAGLTLEGFLASVCARVAF